MHQVALTSHDKNTHSFYESLEKDKTYYYTFYSNNINYGEKERIITDLAYLKTANM